MISEAFGNKKTLPGKEFRSGELGEADAHLRAQVDAAFYEVEGRIAALGGGVDTVVTSTPYNVQDTDVYLLVDAAGAVTINLPAGVNGRNLWIKDRAHLRPAGAGSDNITIVAGIGETIDGQAQFALNSAHAAVQLRFNGTDWSIF